MIVNNEMKNNGIPTNARRYESSFKLFLFYVYTLSPKVYDKLSIFFHWPSIETLIKERDKDLMNVGLNDSMLEYLKELNELKNGPCSLVLDEVSVKPFLVYDHHSGEVKGKSDLGTDESIDKVAKYALTYMVSSPINHCKIPIAFYFSGGQTLSKDLERLSKLIITKLFRIGINIHLLIFDQGTSNRKLYRNLCPNSESSFNITIESETGHSINHSVYVLFDIPHIIKAIRNNLIKYPLSFKDENENEQLANWSFIADTYFIDKEQSISMIPKVKYKHINPTSFEKMKVNALNFFNLLTINNFLSSNQVSTAVQVFSNSYSAAMNVLIGTSQLPKEATGTAILLKLINSLFDLLNNCDTSKSLKENGETRDKLVFYLKVLDSFSFKSDSKIHCLENHKISIRCFLSYQIFIFKTYRIEYILTRHYNQDCLENFFSIMRYECNESGGLRTETFRRDFRQLFLLI